jgi:hypothetical protein
MADYVAYNVLYAAGAPSGPSGYDQRCGHRRGIGVPETRSIASEPCNPGKVCPPASPSTNAIIGTLSGSLFLHHRVSDFLKKSKKFYIYDPTPKP